jgi:hypothetical protein
MAAAKWVYDLASGRFLYGGYYEPSYDPATQGIAEFPDADPNPDVEHERFDATSPTLRRLATTEELTADETAAVDASLDQALSTGDVIILAAAQHLTVLFPDLPEPSPEQVAAFRDAVRSTSKDLLRAALVGA